MEAQQANSSFFDRHCLATNRDCWFLNCGFLLGMARAYVTSSLVSGFPSTCGKQKESSNGLNSAETRSSPGITDLHQFYFSLRHFGHFFAKTFWSVTHFSHLSHSCIKLAVTVFISLYFQTLW